MVKGVRWQNGYIDTRCKACWEDYISTKKATDAGVMNLNRNNANTAKQYATGGSKVPLIGGAGG